MSFQQQSQQKRSSSVLHGRSYDVQDFSNGKNSFSIPKLENYFSSMGNDNLFNVSAITLPSEQTFRQNASPGRSDRHQIMYSEKKRNITNSSIKQSRDRSFDKNIIKTNGSYENSPLRIKPTEKSFQGQQPQNAYKSLPERLVLTKAELNEKSKQLEEIKNKNQQLVSEVKSYANKENQRSSDVESLFNKFNINLRRMSITETFEKYQELLVAYKQNLTQNHKMELSLRQEILTNEEQRAYIETLKKELRDLKLSTMFSNSKNITAEEFEEMQTATYQLGVSQNECFELKQQLERFARSETTLKLMIENLRNDIENLETKKEEFRVSLENNQAELLLSQEQAKILQDEKTQVKKENTSLATKVHSVDSENSKLKGDYEKLRGEMSLLKNEKVKIEERLRAQIEELFRDIDEKDEIIQKINSEKSNFAQEHIRNEQSLNSLNKKLAATRNECDELRKQLIVFEDELQRERRTVVELNCQIKELGLQARSDAKKDKMKEKIKIQQSIQEKMKERDGLLEELERIKGDDVRKPGGHIKVKKLQNLENLHEQESLEVHHHDTDKLVEENKGLHRKVRILADRVNDLKEFQTKYNALFDFVKTINQSLKIICQEKFGLNIEQQFKRQDENLEAYCQQINDIISCLDKVGPNQDHQQKSVNEAMKWKDEAERLREKVKTLNKELTLSSEAQERLYKRLSKVEVELDLSKKGKQPDQEMKPNEEGSLKDLEIEKLQCLVFNEEAKEMITEILQVHREILSNKKSGSKQKTKNENLESRKTVLDEEFYLLQIQEKKRYENTENLEQQNFELQNEVSRLVNELEINFSKYDQSTGAYYTYKRNERQSQQSSAAKPSVGQTSPNSQQNKITNFDASIQGNSETVETAAVKTLKKDLDSKTTQKLVKDISLSRPKRIKKNESPTEPQ